MSKMSNHIVRQREAGIDVREDLTEQIIIVQSAVLTELRRLIVMRREVSKFSKKAPIHKIMAYMKELEEAWDKIKRRVKE